MFTLAISCLTTSSLVCLIHGPNIPGSYAVLFFAALDFTSPVICTAGCCFRFGSISSLFLELFLHSSPVACWAPTNLFQIYRKVNKLMQWTCSQDSTLVDILLFLLCLLICLFIYVYIYMHTNLCTYFCFSSIIHLYK